MASCVGTFKCQTISAAPLADAMILVVPYHAARSGSRLARIEEKS